jgi:hypothetical protein
MAFCNACGATLDAGAKFCNKCGALNPVAGSAAAVAQPGLPAAPQKSNALKIVLIIVGVLVMLFIAGVGTTAFLAWRIAKHTRIENRNGNVRVQTPFGTVESSQDPAEVARNLGVDMYPGARVIKGDSANVNFGGMHTVSAAFEADDPLDKVANFYKSALPGANVSESSSDHYSIVSTRGNKMITVNLESTGSGTRVQISSVSGKMIPGSSANQ